MPMAILWQFTKALFMITPTQQNVCSIVSCQLIAELSPTSRQRVADQLQPISNQLAINRTPVADRSPIFRDSCRWPVADWYATEKMQFWSHSGCIGCSCFSVARQSPTGCSRCVTGGLKIIYLIMPIFKMVSFFQQSPKQTLSDSIFKASKYVAEIFKHIDDKKFCSLFQYLIRYCEILNMWGC